MLIEQIFNPESVKHFLESQKDLLERRFVVHENKRGRPQIGIYWVLVALCIYAKMEGVAWRKLPHKLAGCKFLIEEGYLTGMPSWQKFWQVWNGLRKEALRNWIKTLGTELAKQDGDSLAFDSSGFKVMEGKFWRYLKWDPSFLTKASVLFQKVHIAVEVRSRAIVGIRISKSKRHDSQLFKPLWKDISKRLKRRVRKVYADKAYWSRDIIEPLAAEGKTVVTPPKKNSVFHGSTSAMDQIVYAWNKYPGLYRKNHRPELRSTVEHVFGTVTQLFPIIRDRTQKNKAKALLMAFLRYNCNLRFQEVSSA